MYFCRYCGSETENENCVCDSCNALQQPEASVSETGYTKAYGRKDAIAAAVMGSIGFVLIYVGVILAIASLSLSEDLMAVFDTVVGLVGVVLAILALVKGIQSIKRFKEARKQHVTPVATLVCGIVGVASAGVDFIMLFYLLFALIVVVTNVVY